MFLLLILLLFAAGSFPVIFIPLLFYLFFAVVTFLLLLAFVSLITLVILIILVFFFLFIILLLFLFVLFFLFLLFQLFKLFFHHFTVMGSLFIFRLKGKCCLIGFQGLLPEFGGMFRVCLFCTCAQEKLGITSVVITPGLQ